MSTDREMVLDLTTWVSKATMDAMGIGTNNFQYLYSLFIFILKRPLITTSVRSKILTTSSEMPSPVFCKYRKCSWLRLSKICVCSYRVFGALTEADILKQSIVAFIPQRIVQFINDRSSNPRLVQLRRTAAVSSSVAKRLIEEKAKELRAGKGNHDILTLLGVPIIHVCIDIILTFKVVKANISEDERTRMSDDEMISQMR